jgi:hypothetical protein
LSWGEHVIFITSCFLAAALLKFFWA